MNKKSFEFSKDKLRKTWTSTEFVFLGICLGACLFLGWVNILGVISITICYAIPNGVLKFQLFNLKKKADIPETNSTVDGTKLGGGKS